MAKRIKICLKQGESFILKQNENITLEKIQNDLIWKTPAWFAQEDEDGNRYLFHSSEIEYVKEIAD